MQIQALQPWVLCTLTTHKYSTQGAAWSFNSLHHLSLFSCNYNVSSLVICPSLDGFFFSIFIYLLIYYWLICLSLFIYFFAGKNNCICSHYIAQRSKLNFFNQWLENLFRILKRQCVIDLSHLTMGLYPGKPIVSWKYPKSKIHLIHLIYWTSELSVTYLKGAQNAWSGQSHLSCSWAKSSNTKPIW